MTNPVAPKAETDRPTRRQLDELDALLQRMLALPVCPADGEADAATGPPAADEAESAPPGETGETPDTGAGWEPRAAAGEGPADRGLMTGHAEDEGPGPDRIARPGVPPGDASPPPADEARADNELPPLGLLPLVWLNQTFDCLTIPLGPPGRWLRGRRGRALLGGMGLLLLAGALTWAVADYYDLQVSPADLRRGIHSLGIHLWFQR